MPILPTDPLKSSMRANRSITRLNSRMIEKSEKINWRRKPVKTLHRFGMGMLTIVDVPSVRTSENLRSKLDKT